MMLLRRSEFSAAPGDVEGRVAAHITGFCACESVPCGRHVGDCLRPRSHQGTERRHDAPCGCVDTRALTLPSKTACKVEGHRFRAADPPTVHRTAVRRETDALTIKRRRKFIYFKVQRKYVDGMRYTAA